MSGRLLRLLELTDLGDDSFEAMTPDDGFERLFGGQVASQTLRAATLTVDAGRPPHSLHAYFIRPGRPGIPLRLDVERTRDGRSFATRHVTASQAGEPIFNLSASFHAPEPGDDWQLPAPTELGDPDAVVPADSPMAAFATMSPFEIRALRAPGPDDFPIIHPFWVKTRTALPDDPALHACVLTFMSDMGVVGSARSPVSTLPHRFMGASLDHAVWFHRPVRADDWLLFSVDPVTNYGARGLARGSLHDRNGVLVMSLMQEALLRDTGRVPLP
ncbi:MAG: acyl-CoA thioesterase II [Acidimicrobiales bacterium]